MVDVCDRAIYPQLEQLLARACPPFHIVYSIEPLGANDHRTFLDIFDGPPGSFRYYRLGNSWRAPQQELPQIEKMWLKQQIASHSKMHQIIRKRIQDQAKNAFVFRVSNMQNLLRFGSRFCF